MIGTQIRIPAPSFGILRSYRVASPVKMAIHKRISQATMMVMIMRVSPG